MIRSASVLSLITAALVAHPGLAGGQVAATDEEIDNRLRRLGEEIWDLENMKRKIESERHVVLVTDRGDALVSPEQAANLLRIQVANGSANSASAADFDRKLREDTQIFLDNRLLPQLDAARKELARLTELRSQDPSDRPSLPPAWTVPGAAGEPMWPDPMDWTRVRGSWTGRFWIGCGGRPGEGERTGPFRLVLEGDGRVVGSFEEGGFAWPAPGTIVACRSSGIRCLDMADGWASGEGAGPDGGTYRWDVEVGRSGATLTRVNGYFVYDDPAGECSDHDAGDISDVSS